MTTLTVWVMFYGRSIFCGEESHKTAVSNEDRNLGCASVGSSQHPLLSRGWEASRCHVVVDTTGSRCETTPVCPRLERRGLITPYSQKDQEAIVYRYAVRLHQVIHLRR